jgi:hypothetical protein
MYETPFQPLLLRMIEDVRVCVKFSEGYGGVLGEKVSFPRFESKTY